VCNRDELRTRRRADGPRVTDVRDRRVVAPRDPDGGGTWIAVSDAGLAFVLLNRNRGDARDEARGRRWSRGVIIPAVWDCRSLAAVSSRLTGRSWLTRPFTLLVVDDETCVEYAGVDDVATPVGCHRVPRAMWTTSSCDAVAAQVSRQRLFDRLVSTADPVAQDRFHALPDRHHPHRGVLMSRGDACTVSVTTVEMTGAQVRMAYRCLTAPMAMTVHDLPRGT
jgi:hypothetical protein